MKEFWINNGWDFIGTELFIIGAYFFTSQFYTGSVKKLDLMIEDIQQKGEVSFKVINFDKFLNSQGLDPMRFSSITHLFFTIPSKEKMPQLYSNEYFLKQLSIVLIYKKVYKLARWILLINLTTICIFCYLYGQDIK